MEIKNLETVSFERIVPCLTESFKGYFVDMPSEVEFWKRRFENGRMDRSLSWGCVDNGRLIGFVINGIDFDNGTLVAFNMGTGVIPDFRGNSLVDKMYRYGMPDLKSRGVERCRLEVIDKNERAIRVYKRIGFSANRTLYCYKGVAGTEHTVKIKEVSIGSVEPYLIDDHYSWENKIRTIQTPYTVYKAYSVMAPEELHPCGYFVINPENGYIPQLESETGQWKYLFDAIGQVSQQFKINNIDERRIELLEFMRTAGFENTINQYQMELPLNDTSVEM